MSVAPVKTKYSAPAAGCAADILLALARRGEELSISELSEQTGHSKSLVYRVLAELEPRRYVTKLETGHFTLGLATVELGGAFAVQMPLMSSLRRVCQWLAELTGETVNLGVLQGAHVLYLVREEGQRSVFLLSSVGKLLPANAVALGKAMLALYDDERVREIFHEQLDEHGQLTAITKQTITGLRRSDRRAGAGARFGTRRRTRRGGRRTVLRSHDGAVRTSARTAPSALAYRWTKRGSVLRARAC